jgi:hypothetical protein
MKRPIYVTLIVLLLIVTSTALAQPGGSPSSALSSDYDLIWNTIDGGGGASMGGNYALSGTIGQPDAGAAMNGSGYSLTGGFWGGAMNRYSAYLPLVSK